MDTGEDAPFVFDSKQHSSLFSWHCWSDVQRSAQTAHRRRRFNAAVVNVNGLMKMDHTTSDNVSVIRVLLGYAKSNRWDIMLVSETHLHTETDRAGAKAFLQQVRLQWLVFAYLRWKCA